MWLIWTLGNQDKPMIARVRESAAGDQLPRLSKVFESVNKLFLFA